METRTAEPWQLQETNDTRIVDSETGVIVAVANASIRPRFENVANAKRIVTCVNACAGVPDEALQNTPVRYLLNMLVTAYIDMQLCMENGDDERLAETAMRIKRMLKDYGMDAEQRYQDWIGEG